MELGHIHVLYLHASAEPCARILAEGLGARLHVHDLAGCPGEPFERIARRLEELWDAAQGLIVLAPTGLVVRSIAALLGHKTTDPAVVVCDVHGRWAISLLSGHEGGANALAHRVSDLLEAEPIVTTTSEAARRLTAGIGTRRGIEARCVREALQLAFERLSITAADLRTLATSQAKAHEPGLLEVARELDLPLRLLSHRELRTLRPRVRRTAASRHFPVPAVSEPAALLSGRRTHCLLKLKHRGVTVCIAQELSAWSASGPETPWTAPVVAKRPSRPPAS